MSTDAAHAQARALQRTYWNYLPREHAAIKRLFEQPSYGGLTYADIFRLHHLNCMELIEEELARGLAEPDVPPVTETLPPFAHRVLDVLLSKNSPYAAGMGRLWLTQNEGEDHDFKGGLFNGSLTHLNSIECFRLDEDGQPMELNFIPLKQLQHLTLAPVQTPAPYRLAHLKFDIAERQSWFSAVYGLSTRSSVDTDLDGNHTRPIRLYQVPALGTQLSIGVGQQLFLTNDGQAMRLIPSVHVRRLSMLL